VIRRLDSLATVGEELVVADSTENGSAERDRNAVFARPAIFRVCRARTRSRQVVLDADGILVILRVGVASISHTHIAILKFEFERFVLCSFSDSTRRLKSCKWCRHFVCEASRSRVPRTLQGQKN